jgi:hypothetical protein
MGAFSIQRKKCGKLMSNQNTIEKELYASDLSLKQLLREAEDLCYEHHVEYDERKIFVTTDYGSHVIIFYREKDE